MNAPDRTDHSHITCRDNHFEQPLQEIFPDPGQHSFQGNQHCQVEKNSSQMFLETPRAKNVHLTIRDRQRPSTRENEDDENLSWLLDFRLDSYIEMPNEEPLAFLDEQNTSEFANSVGENLKRQNFNPSKPCDIRKNADKLKRDSSQMMNGASNKTISPNNLKKPPFTYTELIEHALREQGELTVSAIYQWISDHFPYYKTNDDRWKNSVRHNLSINPHFRKGSKAPHGAGHLWAIAKKEEYRQAQLLDISAVTEVCRNYRSVLSSNDTRVTNINKEGDAMNDLYQPLQEINEIRIIDHMDLEDTAEQILNGVKKEVEVQYITPGNARNITNDMTSANYQNSFQKQFCNMRDTDFLNPISKETVVEECGLIGEEYLVADINSSSLSMNMIETEIVSADNLFGEELSFQFYEMITGPHTNPT